jgi:hypothetical protein
VIERFINSSLKDASKLYPGDAIKGSNILGAEVPVRGFLNNRINLYMVIDDEEFPTDEIYFRTESGNIFCICKNRKKVEIINAKLCIKTSILNEDPVSKGELNMRIGEPFRFTNGDGLCLTTTKIIEVFTVSKDENLEDTIISDSEGKTIPILEDFQQLIKQDKNELWCWDST